MVSNMCFLADDLGFDSMEWNTFAPSHGKSAVDGVGGALQNLVWSKIKTQNLNVYSAKGYFEVARKSCKNKLQFFMSPWRKFRRARNFLIQDRKML